jgi:tetratricopeptide (TPR) repeat protein
MHRYRLLLLAAALLLAGCAGPGIYLPPVEDRSAPLSRAPQAAPVEQDTGVRVTPIYDEPVVRQQRLGSDSGFSVQPLYPSDSSDRGSDYSSSQQLQGQLQDNYQQGNRQYGGGQGNSQGNSEAPAAANAAVVALLDSARQQQGAGSLAAAQTSLERAQRIAPRDPQVYYQLADIQRQMQKYSEAEQLALRGVALAGGQPESLRKLWLLIASVRKDTGNLSGARDALEQARRY